MKFLYKLERKFGKYAIPNLINYFIVLCGLGAFLSLINRSFYYSYLILDIGKVLEGQIWRLFTFIIEPDDLSSPINMLFFAIRLYAYYYIGRSLENAWGAFRFNLYIFAGIIFNIIAAIILYLFMGGAYPMGLTYIYNAMFFAFAALYPNIQFLLFYVIPVKVKYLAYIYGIFIAYDVTMNFQAGNFSYSIAILVALANFLIFFLYSRNYRKMSPKEIRRRTKYKKQVRRAQSATRHKCAICGRTEEDEPNLEFRYCSKCDGNYEYCMEHLFSHEHVHKN